MLGDIRKNKLFFGVVTLGIFLSFSFNVFGAMSTNTFLGNFKDSEALVSNQIVCHDSLFDDQLILTKDPAKIATHINSCVPSELTPYSSQFGLQGKVFSFGYQVIHKVWPSLSAVHFIIFVQLVVALASSLLFALIALWTKKRFGLFAAIVVGVLTTLSPMLVGFGRNLYWMLPLLIAPFVFSLYYFRTGRTTKRQILFWVILGILIYLKFLCGYEYVTTITIMAFAPIAYFLFIQRTRLKEYIKYALVVLCVSVVAFALAMLTHITTLTAYTGNFGSSIQVVTQRAQERTVDASQYTVYPYGNLKVIAPNFYDTTNTYVNYDARIASHSVFAASIASFVTYLLIPVVHLPIEFSPAFGEYVQSTAMFIVILIALFVFRKKWVATTISRQVNGLFIGLAIGLVGYGSWLVLAFSHSLVHAHINGILLYLPMALFGYMILGLFIQTLFGKIKQKRKK